VLVAGVLTALVITAAGSAVATVFLSVANRRERALKVIAETREQEANEQRDSARESFRLARSAVDEYCTKVANDHRLRAEDLAGLRQQLLETAVRFYERFVDEHSEDPELRSELGLIYRSLGTVSRDLNNLKKAIQWPKRMDMRGQWEKILHQHDLSDREERALLFYEANREAMDA
jgi:hypothetical protein